MSDLYYCFIMKKKIYLKNFYLNEMKPYFNLVMKFIVKFHIIMLKNINNFYESYQITYYNKNKKKYNEIKSININLIYIICNE